MSIANANATVEARSERLRRVQELFDLQSVRGLTEEEQDELYNHSSAKPLVSLEQKQPDAFAVVDNSESNDDYNHNIDGEYSRNNRFQESGRNYRQLAAYKNLTSPQFSQNSSFNSSGDRPTKRPISKIQLLGDTVAIRRCQMNHIWEQVRDYRPAGLQCEGVIVALGPKHYEDSKELQTLRIGDRVLIPNHSGVTHSLPDSSLIFELFRRQDILALLT